jgi:hypothetical protein
MKQVGHFCGYGPKASALTRTDRPQPIFNNEKTRKDTKKIFVSFCVFRG